MEQLAIIEKICDNLFDSLEPGTAIYIFAAAIYDNWASYSSTQLENNLAKRLVTLWKAELEERMTEVYRKTKYDSKRPDADEYYKKWIDGCYIKYSDNEGLKSALEILWKDRYGFRISWPK